MKDCFALAGEVDKALDGMKNAINLGFINYPVFSQDRFLDDIRNDKRFNRMIERVKYDWEHFEV